MGLLDQYNLRTDENLMRRFIAAMENAATDAINEDPLTVNHEARVKLGRTILDGEAVSHRIFSRYMQLPIAQNNGPSITDIQLQTAANVMFGRVALQSAI